MHELSIAYSLVEIAMEAAEDAGVKRVRTLYMKLGALSGVAKEALLFSFDVAIQGTPLEGARLVVEEVPVKVFCPDCQEARILPEPFPMRCPVCGGKTGQVLEGRELELSALEGGEEDAESCVNPADRGNPPEYPEEK